MVSCHCLDLHYLDFARLHCRVGAPLESNEWAEYRGAPSTEHSLRPSRGQRFRRAWADPSRQTSVALLLSGVITDGGWSQLAYNGLKELQARYGFKTAYARKHQHRADGPDRARLLGRRFRSGHRSRRRIQQHPARSGARLSRPALFRHDVPPATRSAPQHHVRQHGLLRRCVRRRRTGRADF